jgi:hypothetical protein
VGELLSFAADKISRFDIKLVVRPYGHVRRQTMSYRSRSSRRVERDGRAFFHATSFEDVPIASEAFVFDQHR